MKIKELRAFIKAEFEGLIPNKHLELLVKGEPKGLSEAEWMNYFAECLKCKLWRMLNLYTIVDKGGVRRKFKMRRSQLLVLKATYLNKRLLVLKSRQQGISTLFLVYAFDEAIFNKDRTCGLMAQGEDESSSLLSRVKILWEELNPMIKEVLGVSTTKYNTEQMEFNNGSKLRVATSFRSATLQFLHISEFAKIANNSPKKCEEVITGTLQAISKDNLVVIESTPEGDNKFKELWDLAETYGEVGSSRWYPFMLSWLDDPDCYSDELITLPPEGVSYFDELNNSGYEVTQGQKNFWALKYAELGDKIFQEYPANAADAFKKSRDSSYYAKQFTRLVVQRGRVVQGLYDSRLDVQVAVDLGINDFFVMVFFQTFTDGLRIIDYYVNNGESIQHYCELLKERSRLIGYRYNKIILPHDAAIRDLTSGISRKEAFHKGGFTNTYILPRTNINDGIEAVRSALNEMWIDASCKWLIQCFLNYGQQYSEHMQQYTGKPLHNEYSHGADAIRYMVLGQTKYKTKHRGGYSFETTLGI